MSKTYEIDMTRGPLLSRILLFALPLICSGVLQLLFNAADIIVVGRYAGSHAMAAVGATSALINLLVNFFIGISVGANVLVARFRGAGDFDDAQQTVQTALITAVAGGALLVVIGIALARPMLVWMATPAEVLDQAVLYMRIYFIGMPATMLYNFGAAILRAVGDTRRPLYFLMFSGVVNVLCNLFFVIVLHMGVAGVATATVIAQVISATLIVLCLMRVDGMCNVNLKNIHFHADKFARMMQVGLPAGLQSVIFNISNVLIQSSINSFGAIVVAGNTAASNIEGFVYTSMNALYQTSLSFTSQNLGAKQYRRIDQVLLRCAILVVLIGLVLGNGAHLLGRQLLGIYSTDAEVVSFGLVRLGVVSVTYCLCGLMDVIAGSVRGMGYSILPMLVSLAGACVFRIIWIFTIFRWQHTLFSLYISYPISWGLTICAHLACYFIVRRQVFPPKGAQLS
ncbi:MAG TPA: MATE family efflux transporter [Candidatus Agathobaculum intestinipullorum]|nr:MATE family efflux transporter [Candidatus Agathobaculum intestinipullorum]